MEVLVMFFGWIVFAIGVGVFAGGRGRNGAGWGFLALLISPLLAFIIVAVLPDLASAERDRQERARAESRVERGAQDEAQRIQGADVALRIEKLRQLREKGLLTDPEYAARKQKVFNDLQGKHLVETCEDFLSLLLPLIDNGALTADETARLKAFAFQEAPAPTESKRIAPQSASTPTNIPCPKCGGLIHPEASTCMHCWAKLTRAAV